MKIVFILNNEIEPKIMELKDFIINYQTYKIQHLENKLSNPPKYLSLHNCMSEVEDLTQPTLNQFKYLAKTSALIQKEYNKYMKSDPENLNKQYKI